MADRIYLDEATPEQLRAELARREAEARDFLASLPDIPDWHEGLVAAGLVRDEGGWSRPGSPMRVIGTHFSGVIGAESSWMGWWQADEDYTFADILRAPRYATEEEAARAWLAARAPTPDWHAALVAGGTARAGTLCRNSLAWTAEEQAHCALHNCPNRPVGCDWHAALTAAGLEGDGRRWSRPGMPASIWRRGDESWEALHPREQLRTYLGPFPTEEAAARAWLAARGGGR